MVLLKNIEGAPSAIGAYSHCVVSNGLLFVSGQLGIDPKTMKLEDSVVNQAKMALMNLRTIIEGAGFRVKNIVKCTVYLTDMADFKAVNEVYGEFMGGHKPARVAVAVSELPMGALVEIDAIVGE